jgi:hypothetical protein
MIGRSDAEDLRHDMSFRARRKCKDTVAIQPCDNVLHSRIKVGKAGCVQHFDIDNMPIFSKLTGEIYCVPGRNAIYHYVLLWIKPHLNVIRIIQYSLHI